LENKIRVIGKVQKYEVIALMNKSELFVHPTISREPFPTTLIESMAVGTPVISTLVGGIPEMIKSGYNGLLVSPTVDTIGGAIMSLLKNPEGRERISINGLREIKTKYNQKRKIGEYCKLIGNLSK